MSNLLKELGGSLFCWKCVISAGLTDVHGVIEKVSHFINIFSEAAV